MFVATTAIESFWGSANRTVFLGTWCLRFERREFAQSGTADVLRYPLATPDSRRAAYDDVREFNDRILPGLAHALNQVHGVQFDTRYWQIIIGPWLIWYLTVIHERFLSITSALEEVPSFETIGLDPESYVTPRDTLDFVTLAEQDAYNLQLYTELLECLGHEMPRRPGTVRNSDSDVIERSGQPEHGVAARVRSTGRTIVRQLARMRLVGRTGLIRNAHFTGRQELELAWRTRGRFWPVTGKIGALPDVVPDARRRTALAAAIPNDSAFGRVLGTLLPRHMPQCFVESFDTVRTNVRERFPAAPKVIISSDAWCHDEAFKVWVAECSARGTQLAGIQHGGNYGIADYLPHERHELAVLDRFYSWGWVQPTPRAAVTPMASADLSRRGIPSTRPRARILLASTIVSQYFTEHFPLLGSMEEYLEWQYRFVGALDESVRADISVRLHRKDFDWKLAERWHDAMPDVQTEQWATPWPQRLTECRLYVFDHNSTTHLQGLAANVPTVLFWNPESTRIRPAARVAYARLEEAGILYHTAAAAAHAVNQIYPRVESWWREPARQAARAEFCRQFARRSDQLVDEWAVELNRLADEVDGARPAVSA